MKLARAPKIHFIAKIRIIVNIISIKNCISDLKAALIIETVLYITNRERRIFLIKPKTPKMIQ